MRLTNGLNRASLGAAVVLVAAYSAIAGSSGISVVGGEVAAVAVSGGRVFAGSGARLLVFGAYASSSSGYSQTGSSSPFADLVRGVSVRNQTAYVAAGADGLHILDVSGAGDPVERGSLSTPGYAEGVAVLGKLALIADGPLGLRVVDVSNPAQPVEAGCAYEGKQAMAVAVDGSYAYVAAGGAGLLIGDISQPSRPVEVSTVQMYGFAAGVVLNGNYAYVMNSWGGIGIVNVANPRQPYLVTTYATPGWAVKASIAGGTMAVADAYHGVRILDISNPTGPVEQGSSDTYLTDVADVAFDGTRIWTADRHDGLRLVAYASGYASSEVYDTFARAWSVAISANYAYVAAMERGLRIVDISDPTHLREVGIYPCGNAAGVTVNYPYVYLSVFFGDNSSGFHVVDVSDPRNPKRVGFIPNAALPMNVPRDHATVGTTSYVTNEAGLIVIDASDPTNPAVAGFASALNGSATLGVAVSNQIAYVAQEGVGLLLFDVSDAHAPKLIGSKLLPMSPQDVALSGRYALVAQMAGVSVVDVSNPANLEDYPAQLNSGRGISVSGNRAYLATTGAGVDVVDISDPTAPKTIGTFRTPGYARKAVAQGGRLWIADAETGLWSVPLTSIGTAQATQSSALPLVRSMLHRARPASGIPVHPGRRAAHPAATVNASGDAPPVASCVVTNTNNDGAGSLRSCLAGIAAGGTIAFDPGAFPPDRLMRIHLLSPLPSLSLGNVTIDGSVSWVDLDGSGLAADSVGLTIDSDRNVIQGLTFDYFPGTAVLISGGAKSNVIGGDRTQGTGRSGRGNTIVNGTLGIVISGAGTSQNVVIGNYFGVAEDGVSATYWAASPGSNHSCVAIVAGATSNRVGSTVAGERNLFGNCEPNGLLISDSGTTDNVAIGNYFGPNATGNEPLLCGGSPCAAASMSVAIQGGAARNRLGGTAPGERNVLTGSGNYAIGVNDRGTADNAIVGNYVGTYADGATSIPSNNIEIWLDGASARTLIQNNVIASNELGIAGDYNVVIGNIVAADATGKNFLGGGVFTPNMRARRNRVGGAGAGEGNVIAAGAGPGPGVSLGAPGTEENYIIGNLIGTDITGAALARGVTPSPYAASVPLSDGAKRNVVGGSSNVEGNLIAGSGGAGVQVLGFGASFNFIGQNWIGANRGGSHSIANHSHGVVLQGSAGGFVIGNHIAGNWGAGVALQNANATVRANSIHDNLGTGILVQTAGSSFWPALGCVAAASVEGTACENCVVELFSDHGSQGAVFEGAVRASATGAFTFSKAAGFEGPNLTATATSPQGLTSQFSNPVPAAAKLNARITHTDNYTEPQANRTYTITVSNSSSGGATAGAVSVTETVSAGVALVSMSGDGWTCVGNTCTRNDELAPGGNWAPITVVVSVGANAPLHGTDEVTVSGGGSSTVTATDSAFDGVMAHLAIGGGWATELTLMNLGSTAAPAHLDFYDESGAPMALSVTSSNASGTTAGASWDQTMAAGALAVLDPAGSSSQTTQVGSAQLLTSGNLNGFAIFRNEANGHQATVPLESRDAAAYTLAFDNTGSVVTSVALANIADQAAQVPVVVRGEDGAALVTDTIELPARGHTSFVLTAQYPVTSGRRGSVQFAAPAGSRVSALGLRFNGGAITTLPILADTAPGGGTFTHIAAGGGWQTTLTLVNLQAGSVHAHIDFHDNGGAPLALSLSLPAAVAVTTTSTLDLTLDAGETLSLVATGDSSGATLTGSATLTADGTVSGFGIFGNLESGQEAVVPIEDRNRGAYLLAFDSTNGLITGLAVANASLAAATIPVTLRDDSGTVLDTVTLNLAGQGHASFLLSDLSSAAAGKRGTIEFDVPANGEISALGLRFTPAGVFTTLPSMAR